MTINIIPESSSSSSNELELQHSLTNAICFGPNNTNCNTISLRDKLQQWVLVHNVSKNSVNSLLEILRSEKLDLPKDVRTLMNTPRSHTVIDMNPGTYIHLGLKKNVINYIKF